MSQRRFPEFLSRPDRRDFLKLAGASGLLAAAGGDVSDQGGELSG